MNTTKLIGRWSMDGAMEDVAARFRSSVDIIDLLSSGGREQSASAVEPPVVDSSLWVKRAGDDDWQPLPA